MRIVDTDPPVRSRGSGCATRHGQIRIAEHVAPLADPIACAASARSKPVIPVGRRGALPGVFAVDSDRPGTFTANPAGTPGAVLRAVFDDGPGP